MALKVGELYASFGIDSSDLSKALSGIEKQCEQAAATLAKSGAALSIAVTTPLVALGKDVLQSSIDFESAFAGVIKTVDSDELAAAGMTFDDLADSLKKMSLAAPQTTDALAGIMEAGGQLGIQVTALSEFTETIAALGVATNMTTDEAASMFAKFANITGMDQSEFDSLGSTIVALGNNFATTENDIMSMAMRMASAGTTIGMAETDILAFATAMSSVGIMAEVGGSSFSTFASNLSLAVATSSADLETYASVAGMTADEFATAFGQDATSAMVAFISGLNDMERNGMSAIQLLDQLGITEVGQRNMLLSLANSGTLLAESINMSSDAWEDNIALLKEAQTRYGTTESQIQIMKNAMELIKIDLGDFALPYIKDLTADVVGATEAFLAMDDSTKLAGIKLAAVAAAAGPVLTALGGIVGAVGNLVPMMGALISPLGLVGAGFALFAVAAVDANNDIGRSLESMSKIAQKSLSSGNKSLTATMKKVSSRIPALASSIVKVIGNTVPGVIELGFTAVTGFANTISDNADVIANIGMTMVENVCSGLAGGLPELIPAAARMVTSIGSALISNLPRLVSSIGEIAASIWDGLKAVDWLALGKQLVTSIGTALSGIVDVVSGWFASAKEAVQGLTWSDIGESIKSGINIASDWLKNLIAGDAGSDTVTWSSIGSSIWSSIKSGISATGDWLKELILPDSYIASDASWATVGSVVWDAIKSGISASGDWIKELVLGNDYTPDASWSSVGSALWSSITSGISVTGDWLKSLVLGDSYTPDANWSSVGSAIWEQVKTGVSATGDWIKGLVLGDTYTADASWSTVGASIWEKIQSGITATGDWVKSLILGDAFTADSSWTDVGEEIVNKISSGLASLDLTGEALSAKMASLGSFVQNLVTSMLESKADHTAAITTFVTDLVGSISSFDGWAALGTTFNTIASALIDGIVNAIPSVASAATNIISSLGDMFSSIDWEQIQVNLDGFGDILVNGLTKGISALGDAGVQIVSALGSVLSNIDWEALGDTAESIGDVLIDGIVAGIGSLANAGTQLVDALSNVISNINWEEAGTAAADLAGSLFNGLLEGAATITPDVSELLSALGRGIAAAGDGLGEAASSIVSSLIQGLVSPENWESLIKTGAVIIDGLVVGMLDLGMGVLEGAAKTIGGVFEGIFIGLGIIPDYSEETKAALKSTVDVVNSYGEEMAMSVQWATGNLKTLGGAVAHSMAGTSSEWLRIAMESWSAVSTQGTAELIAQYQEFSWLGVSQITDCFAILTDATSSEIQQAAAIIALQDLGLDEFIANATADMDPAVRAAMGKTLAYLQGEGIDSFEAAFAMLGITIPEAVQAGLDAGLPLVEAAAAAAVNAASTANEQATAEAEAAATGKGVTTSLADAEKEGASTVSDASTDLVDSATLALETLPDTASLLSTKATTGMSTSIDNGKSAVVTSMENLSSEVVEAALKEMSYATGYETGQEYVSGIQKGISSLQAAVSAVAAVVASNARNTASNIMSFSIGSGIGYQFSNGIASGIRSGISAISSAAIAAANAALSAATGALGIHSPSTVAKKEVGFMYDYGIAEGILGRIGTVEKASAEVAEALHSSFLVGDPSRGTVYTSGQTVRQTAKETAASANESKSMLERAKAIGLAIAEELIDSGALDGDFYVDGEKAGRKVAGSVSRKINRDSKKTITGRTGKAVLA